MRRVESLGPTLRSTSFNGWVVDKKETKKDFSRKGGVNEEKMEW